MPDRAKSSRARDESVVRIGTRGSELAVRQAKIVAAGFEARGVVCELVRIRTTGDKKKHEPLAAIGAKGLFTKELESALRRKKVDCCVHSLKDLPTEDPEGLEIAAVLEREDPRDVLVINPITDASSLADLPAGSRVGTSSLRRRAQLLAARGDLDVVELRGNVPTRLKKMDEGRFHAAVLAAAGLIRLGARQRIDAFLDAPEWLPAAGQGVIAVQIRSGDDRLRSLAADLDHGPTRTAVRAERAFLAALEGGCQVPIGALAMRVPGATGADAGYILHGLISDVSGRQVVRGSQPVDPADPERSGEELAADIRARGGSSILAELRAAETVPPPQPE